MINIRPYYDENNSEESKEAFEREYLKMVAAVTPFYPEDVLDGCQEGSAAHRRAPKPRKRRQGGRSTDTDFAKLLAKYEIRDGDDRDGQVQAEAELAEKIIKYYSEGLHHFLYGEEDDFTPKPGRVNPQKLRALLLVKLPNGNLPKDFKPFRSGAPGKQNPYAKDLYNYVFPYEKFSGLTKTSGHWGVHDLVARLGVKVCPYCNRSFTTTVNEKTRKVRPQLDHFRNKSDYPFLALSINNLVPACGVCNLLKLDKDKDYAYPYEEGFADGGFVFKSSIPSEHTVPALEGIRISEEVFAIRLEGPRTEDQDREREKRERDERITNSINDLALTELYQSHRDYVSFLYRQRYILTDELAADICKQFKELYETVEEVKAIFTLMYTDQEHWGDRPLAKLTHDIVAEIDELYAGEKNYSRDHDTDAGAKKEDK